MAEQAPTEVIRSCLFVLALLLIFFSGWNVSGYGVFSAHMCLMLYAWIHPYSVPEVLFVFGGSFVLWIWGGLVWERKRDFLWRKPLFEFIFSPVAWTLAVLSILLGNDNLQQEREERKELLTRINRLEARG